MRTYFIRRGWLLAVIALCTIAAPAFALAPLVNATIEPSQIVMGESAELTITSSGTGMEAVSLPEVFGLEFRVVGQSRRISIINGATLATTSIVVRITPQAAGIYTIPGITPKSQPLVLRVNPNNGTPTNSAGKPLPGANTSGIRMTPDGSAFIRLVLPKREIYVGESIPVEIEVGLRDGFARLNGLPTMTGGDFTLNNLSAQPERNAKVIDGKPFTVITWHSVIAPVKPGKFSLAMESPFTVKIRTRPQRESMLDDLLGDPFLQNFFGATVQKDITVTSPASDLTVSPLPTEDRPPDFSGAVGSFKIASEISTPAAAAGDPLTLRMHVTGSGNFDRVDSAMLEHLDQWKTYPPKSSFKASDAIGNKGEKIFEQPLIASKVGPQTLPGLAFSYFDPTTRRYETARTAPLSVTIAPSAADSSLAAQQAPSNSPAPLGTPANPNNGLRPDHLAAGVSASSLLPLYLQPRFLVVPSLLALVFAGGWLGLRRQSDPSDRRRMRKRGAFTLIDRDVKEMEAAARAGDAALFFNLARAALLRTLAARWQLAPDELTPDEVHARLGGKSDRSGANDEGGRSGGSSVSDGRGASGSDHSGASDGANDGSDGGGGNGASGGSGSNRGGASDGSDESADIRQIFALADEANYAGHDPTTTDLARWLQIVRRRLMDEKP